MEATPTRWQHTTLVPRVLGELGRSSEKLSGNFTKELGNKKEIKNRKEPVRIAEYNK